MKLSIKNIKIGMCIGEDLFSQDGQLIAPKDTIVTNDVLNNLHNFNIETVEISKLGNMSQNIFDVTSTSNFAAFENDCAESAEKLSSSLEDIISDEGGEKIQAIESLSGTLYQNNKNNLNLLDMIYNMRINADSVYSHSLNVAMIASQLGRWLDFSEEDVQLLMTCGLFHDIGKLLIPKEILDKPGKLSDEEFEIIKSHVVKGHEFLNSIEGIDERVKSAALNHHERCDGSGYPNGLKGDEIDKYSKVIAIADVYAAMTADRNYREVICPFTVAAQLEKEGLHKFDTQYVIKFLDKMLNSYLQSTVELSNGQVGTVIMINRFIKSKPLVELLDGTFIDLSKNQDISVVRIL